MEETKQVHRRVQQMNGNIEAMFSMVHRRSSSSNREPSNALSYFLSGDPRVLSGFHTDSCSHQLQFSCGDVPVQTNSKERSVSSAQTGDRKGLSSSSARSYRAITGFKRSLWKKLCRSKHKKFT